MTRRLPVFAGPTFRQALSTCARRAGLGPASLVLYDVSTLYFETDAGDGFREPGFSKGRRPEPQITIRYRLNRGGNRDARRTGRAAYTMRRQRREDDRRHLPPTAAVHCPAPTEQPSTAWPSYWPNKRPGAKDDRKKQQTAVG
ncbi:MAG: hypothetical protein ACLPPO_13770 [Mycobacterium sp.]